MSSPNNAYKTYRNLTTTGATSAETGILSCAVGMHRGGGVQITGTFSATLQFEETLDGGTTWIAKTVYPAGGGPGVTSATSTGQWKFANGGSTNFRVRCSAFTSGPVAVALTLTEGVDPVATGAAVGPVGGGITYTDKTITSLSGSSQTLIAANSSRKSLMFKNGASPVAVNILGGTAAIGGAGCMTFQAYEGFALTGADCPLGAITVIGTAANYIGAFEGT